MRIHAAKIVSIAALAAVVLGTVYASAAPNVAVTKGSNGSSLRTVAAPIRNVAHVYSVSATGGTGQVSYTIPNPGRGVYAASFTANFYPQGSPSAPATFSCYIIANGLMLAQSTSSSTYSSGFYVGVNGGNTVRLTDTSTLSLGCGTADGSAWNYGTRQPQVTLTKLDGMIGAAISAPARISSASVATR
jgi:hypothetical protein